MLAAIGAASRLAPDASPRVPKSLPRIRFHWMVKNIDGLWATAGLSSEDHRRRVGRLLAEARMEVDGRRPLEVLYCECCGTQLLAGYKTRAFQPGRIDRFELAPMPPAIEGLPEASPQTRTDAQAYSTLGVVHLIPTGWGDGLDPSDLQWLQRSEEREEQSKRPVHTARARWEMASLDPSSGIVEVGAKPGDDRISCLWFHLDATEELSGILSAMPQRCPSCRIDYSIRKGGKLAPIRSFATGLNQTSLLLTNHLMGAMPAGAGRKLVAFSDSRQSAAMLAHGVESEQWVHLLRVAVLRELRQRAGGGIDAIKRELLDALHGGKEEDGQARLLALKESLPPAEFQELARCARRSRTEPPYRLNREPGVEADAEMVGCG